MGTIVTRKRAGGTVAYLARIVIKRQDGVVYRENLTFDRKQVAAAWIAKRETELREPGALDRAAKPTITLADAIARFLTENRRAVGRSRLQVMQTLQKHALGQLRCDDITSQRIVEFASERRQTRSPSTVAGYLSGLSAGTEVAKPAWGYPLDKHAMTDALSVARRLGLIGRSNERDRRPTLDEIGKLMQHYAARRSNASPMIQITAFAIFSTRRLEEITRLRWDDLDGDRILVRVMKDPRAKTGNHVHVNLTPEASAIIDAMPRTDERIFPYNGESISAAFTRACQLFEITHLHFHDMRHEGISRLFEMGWNIPNVAAVSGHRSWNTLKRYAHIRQTGDKYENWSRMSMFKKHSADAQTPEHIKGVDEISKNPF